MEEEARAAQLGCPRCRQEEEAGLASRKSQLPLSRSAQRAWRPRKKPALPQLVRNFNSARKQGARASQPQAEGERPEKSQEQGSCWAELPCLPPPMSSAGLGGHSTDWGRDFFGLRLAFPRLAGRRAERDAQGLQAAGEGAKAELNKEEEIAKLQNDLLHLNPAAVDEANESIEQGLSGRGRRGPRG